MRYDDLKDQTVLITGGATGIGAALVRSFAEEGANVFFCDIQEKDREKLRVAGPGRNVQLREAD